MNFPINTYPEWTMDGTCEDIGTVDDLGYYAYDGHMTIFECDDQGFKTLWVYSTSDEAADMWDKVVAEYSDWYDSLDD